MTSDEEAPAAGIRRPWSRAVTVVVGLGILAGGFWLVATRWDELVAAGRLIGISRLTLAFGLTVLGVVCTAECWRVWLDSLHPGVPRVTAHQIFYVTQSGKYLPGSVWPFVAQAAISPKLGMTRRTMVTATALFLITHVATGCVVGLGAARGLSSEWLWLMGPAAFGALLAMTPAVLRRLLRLTAHRRSASQEVPSPSWRTIGHAAASMGFAWLAYGSAALVLAEPLGATIGDGVHVIGSYAVAWVVGFLTFVAPAGVGAREAMLVGLLTPLVGLDGSLVVALITRFALTIADLGLGAASANVLRRLVESSR